MKTKLLSSGLPVLIFIALIIYGLLFPAPVFVRDSAYYWDLRRTFFDHAGHFSLTNYADKDFQLRGYVFPLLLLAADTVTPDGWMSASLTVLALNAAIFTALGWFLLPALFFRLTAQPVSLAFRALLSGLLFFFWRGFLFYPLSDFPAFALLLSGLLAIAASASSGAAKFRSLALAFLAGVLLMATYLTRPAYLLALPAAWLLTFLPRNRPWWMRFMLALAFLVGSALLLWPQYRINQRHYGLNSPFISNNLYAFHIENGFVVQRFEVNQNLATYPLPNARFYDLQAQSVLKRAGIASLSLPLLPGLLFSYPLEVVSVYFRHLFNGLTPFYPTPYVNDVLHLDLWLLWGSYTVLFAALAFFDWRSLLQARPWPNFLILTAWLLPVLTAIPAVTEVRFYLPLNALLLTIFTALSLRYSNSRPFPAHPSGWLGWALLYSFFLLSCFSLAGQIFLSMGPV